MFKSKIQNPKSKINPNIKYPNPKFCRLSFVIWISFVIWTLSFVISTIGCATIRETAKGVAGISTKVLEDNRKSAITKTFNYDYLTCYAKTLETLKQIGTYIYAKDANKKMIAIYVSEQDTTPVGLFFKQIDQNNTQVEVSSPSTNAKELIAAKLFSILGKLVNSEKKED